MVEPVEDDKVEVGCSSAGVEVGVSVGVGELKTLVTLHAEVARIKSTRANLIDFFT